MPHLCHWEIDIRYARTIQAYTQPWAPLWENMTSSTKTISTKHIPLSLQKHQAMTKDNTYRKFCEVWTCVFKYPSRHRNIHTDTYITILCTPTWGKVTITSGQVIWHKAASLPQTHNPITYARLRQCAPHVTHASFSPPESTIQTASRSVQPFLHSSWQSIWACPGMSFPLKIAPSHGDLDPHLILISLGPPESITQTASRSVQPFLHSSRQTVHILYNGRPFPKNCPFPWRTRSTPNTWFLGPIQCKQHLDWFSHFAWLTTVTYRPTDHTTLSVTTCCIYIRSTAMWPNNKHKHLSGTLSAVHQN